MDLEFLVLLSNSWAACYLHTYNAEISVTSNNKDNRLTTLYFFFHGYHEKDALFAGC